jgi:predicted enzyme related to lactoylglutathione lyase
MPSGKHYYRRYGMGSPVTWFEIYSTDPQELYGFYGDVFGWKVEPLEGAEYGIVDTDSGHGIGGGIGMAEGPNETIFSIEVDDPQAFLDRVEANGGKTVVPVTEAPPVTFARFADPQGNIVGLFKWTS